MSEVLEECVNDVGLRFKRKKKALDKNESSKSEFQKPPQQLIKEKELPPKKPTMIDLKKSLAKLDVHKNEEEIGKNYQNNKNNQMNKNDPSNKNDILNKNVPSYPKISNDAKSNINFEGINKEAFPEFRWISLVKEIANFEFQRINDTYKSNSTCLQKCKKNLKFFWLFFKKNRDFLFILNFFG